jgi:hypothetical protein
MRPLFALLLGVSLLLGGCDGNPHPPAAGGADDPWAAKTVDGVVQLTWEELMPPGGNPQTLYDKVSTTGLLTDENEDPLSQAVVATARAISAPPPVVESLNGRRVRLSGLVVPLEGDGEKMSEFLLVPYFGACIHVPPPPANQTVYVRTGPEKADETNLSAPVTVTGTLHTVNSHNDAGDAGYMLEASKVEPYQ